MNIRERAEIQRRPEYTLENTGRIFTVLRGFGMSVTPQDQFLYDQVWCGIDLADQLIDNPKHFPDSRGHISAYLTGKQDALPPEYPQLAAENFSLIRGLVAERGVSEQLDKSLSRLFLLSDQLSVTHSVREYVEFTRQEGAECAKICLLLAPEEFPPMVRHFMTQAGVLGNLADNLLDLEGDFKEGRIAIRPTQGLKLALKMALARQVALLSWLYPQKGELMGLAKKYIAMMFKSTFKQN